MSKRFFQIALTLLISSSIMSFQQMNIQIGFASPGVVGPSTAVDGTAPAEDPNANPDDVVVPNRTGPPSIYSGGLLGPESTEGRYSIQNIRDNLLPSVARWVAGLLGAIAVLALIWSGVLFLTAGGDADSISKAVKSAFYTLAALLLMMFGYVLVYLFLTIFTP
jgi:hypothetical protein